MAEEQHQPSGLPLVTVDTVKQKMAIALTKLSLSTQKMQDEADSLIFNEDQENLVKIKNFIEKTKKAEKAVKAEFDAGKKPYLLACEAWNDGKNDILKAIGDINAPVTDKYSKLCNEIDRKKREEEQKNEREKQIKAGIESNILNFSQKIAACATKKELTDVERLINLEKSESRATKYGEFHQLAIDRYNEVLLPVIKEQKTKIEEKEKLAEQLKTATDPEKYDELKEKLDEKENEILQNQVEVQEKALNQVPEEPIEPIYITPSIKPKRTDIVPEIVDVNAVFKKNRELLKIELKIVDAKKLGDTLHSAGAFGNKDEITVDGIKYTIKKSW